MSDGKKGKGKLELGEGNKGKGKKLQTGKEGKGKLHITEGTGMSPVKKKVKRQVEKKKNEEEEEEEEEVTVTQESENERNDSSEYSMSSIEGASDKSDHLPDFSYDITKDENYYDNSDEEEKWGPTKGVLKIGRGGSLIRSKKN